MAASEVILGINAYHADASACVVANGEVVAAAEEERFRRVKHWAGFPAQAIAYCLREAGVRVSGVGHVAINTNPKANVLRRVGYTMRQRPELSLIVDRLRNQGERTSVASELQAAFPQETLRAQIHRVEHHLAHLASTFLVSPFAEAVAVSVDGFGDFASAAWGLGRGHSVAVDERVHFPHSLGIFYQALTQYLGFPNYGDEYKVMGLAPYGRPEYLDVMRHIVRLQDDGTFQLNLEFFRHHKERIAFDWNGGSPTVGRLYSEALEQLLGPARQKNEPLEDRHRDIARSVQAMYEEAFYHLLYNLHLRYNVDRVALAGGCAMNSVANGQVRLHTPFKEVYVQSAAADAGGALGAAVHVWHQVSRGNPGKRFEMDHAYLGPSFSNAHIEALLTERKSALEAAGCTVAPVESEAELCTRTAAAIARGLVIGWLQGRMEWGPRALGNRSILCDPRRADMKDILNRKIKRRESFRPFAPSVLREAAAEWFEQDDDVPFMMKVFQIRPDKRERIPAVTHVDGSGRLQTVYRHTNPRYHALISAFAQHTGVPMVLNTSFNENEPVVCQPSEALDCFLRTNMDVLVMQNWMVWRQEAQP